MTFLAQSFLLCLVVLLACSGSPRRDYLGDAGGMLALLSVFHPICYWRFEVGLVGAAASPLYALLGGLTRRGSRRALQVAIVLYIFVAIDFTEAEFNMTVVIRYFVLATLIRGFCWSRPGLAGQAERGASGAA